MKPFPEVPWIRCDRSKATDAQIAEWRAACPSLDAEYEAAVRERIDAIKTIRDLTYEVFGQTSKEGKYIGKWRLPMYHDKPSRRLENLEADVRRYREADTQKAKKAAEDAERQAFAARAVLWLAERGKMPGKDYTGDAIEYANGIAYDEEVARRKAELSASGGLVPFDGDDNCEDCGGWDGEERRCECGNRRVDWVASWGHSFEHPSVNGEAY